MYTKQLLKHLWKRVVPEQSALRASYQQERKTKMKIIKIIKLMVGIAIIIATLCYCGYMDSEYEAEREMMATQQPRRQLR